MIDLAGGSASSQWISLGAIPAAVPHTRQVPIMGTEASPGLLRGEVTAGPAGTLRVPSALVSALEIEVAAAGIPALGYFAQVPHYVSGPYATAALELLRALGTALGADHPGRRADEEARELRTRLDTAAGLDESTRGYVERLEAMYDEQRLPSGDDLISDIERFLRDQGGNTPPQAGSSKLEGIVAGGSSTDRRKADCRLRRRPASRRRVDAPPVEGLGVRRSVRDDQTIGRVGAVPDLPSVMNWHGRMSCSARRVPFGTPMQRRLACDGPGLRCDRA